MPFNDIDVLVADNTAVDLDIYQYWLDGLSGKNKLLIQKNI